MRRPCHRNMHAGGRNAIASNVKLQFDVHVMLSRQAYLIDVPVCRGVVQILMYVLGHSTEDNC